LNQLLRIPRCHMVSTFCIPLDQMRLSTNLLSAVAAMISFDALIDAAQPWLNRFNDKNTLSDHS
jgi:hypothetical protein